MPPTGLMILTGFFQFILGKSLGWGATWAKDAAVGALKPVNQLDSLFSVATSEWRAALPDEFRSTDFEPNLFWNAEIAIDKTNPSELAVAKKLWSRESPTPDEFFRMLKNRYRMIQQDGEAQGNHLSAFWTADVEIVDHWLYDFAERLREVCVGFPPLGTPTFDKQLRRIEVAVGLSEDTAEREVAEPDPALLRRYYEQLNDAYELVDDRGIHGPVKGRSVHDGTLKYLYVHPRLESVLPSTNRRVFSRDGNDEEKQTHEKALELTLVEFAKKNRRAVVLGEPGSGKSTLLRYLALRCIEEPAGTPAVMRESTLFEEDGGWLIPVVVPLAEVPGIRQPEGPRTIEELVQAHLDRFLEKQLADDLWSFVADGFRTGTTVLFLDGLDEVYEQRVSIARELDGFFRRHPRARAIISSRPHAEVELKDVPCFIIKSFSNSEVRDFLRRRARWRLSEKPDELHAANYQADELSHRLARNKRMKQLAQTPLMLVIISLAEATHPGCLPSRRISLYETIIQTQLEVPRASTTHLKLDKQVVFEFWCQAVLLLAHRGTLGGMYSGAALRSALKVVLASRSPDQGVNRHTEARALLAIAARERGLLHSSEPNEQYQFWHQTIAEYMAAWATAHDLDRLEENLVALRDSPQDTVELLRMVLEMLQVEQPSAMTKAVNTIAFARVSCWEEVTLENLRLASFLLQQCHGVKTGCGERVLAALAEQLCKLPEQSLGYRFVQLARHLPVNPSPGTRLVDALRKLVELPASNTQAWLLEEAVRHLLPVCQRERSVVDAFARKLAEKSDLGGKVFRSYMALGLIVGGDTSPKVLAQVANSFDAGTPSFEEQRLRSSPVHDDPRTDVVRQAALALSRLDLDELGLNAALERDEFILVYALAGHDTDEIFEWLWAARNDRETKTSATRALMYLALLDTSVWKRLLPIAFERREEPSRQSPGDALRMLDGVFHDVGEDRRRTILEAVIELFPPGEQRARSEALKLLVGWGRMPSASGLLFDFTQRAAKGEVAVDPLLIVALTDELATHFAGINERASHSLWICYLNHEGPLVRSSAAGRLLRRQKHELRSTAFDVLVATVREEISRLPSPREVSKLFVSTPMLKQALQSFEFLWGHSDDWLMDRLAEHHSRETDDTLRALFACALVKRDAQLATKYTESLRVAMKSAVFTLKWEAFELVRFKRIKFSNFKELQLPLLECCGSLKLNSRIHSGFELDWFGQQIQKTLPLGPHTGRLAIIGCSRLLTTLSPYRLPKTQPDVPHPVLESRPVMQQAFELLESEDNELRVAAHVLVNGGIRTPRWRGQLVQALAGLGTTTAFGFAKALLREGDGNLNPDETAALAEAFRRMWREGDAAQQTEALECLWRAFGGPERHRFMEEELDERKGPEHQLRVLKVAFEHTCQRYGSSRSDDIVAVVSREAGLSSTRLMKLVAPCLVLPAAYDRLVAVALYRMLDGESTLLAATLAELAATGDTKISADTAKSRLLPFAFRSWHLQKYFRYMWQRERAPRIDKAAILMQADVTGTMTDELQVELLSIITEPERGWEYEQAVVLWSRLAPNDWSPVLSAVSAALANSQHRLDPISRLLGCVARTGLRPRELITWLLDQYVLNGNFHDAIDVESCLQPFVKQSQTSEAGDNSDTTGEPTLRTLVDEIAAPHLRLRLAESELVETRLLIATALDVLDALDPSDTTVADDVGNLLFVDWDDPNSGVAWNLFGRLPEPVRMKLVPGFVNAARSGTVHAVQTVKSACYATLFPTSIQCGLLCEVLEHPLCPSWQRLEAAQRLLELDPKNQRALDTLNKLLEEPDVTDQYRVAFRAARELADRGHRGHGLREVLMRVATASDASHQNRLQAAFILFVAYGAKAEALASAQEVIDEVLESDEYPSRKLDGALALAFATGAERILITRTLLQAFARGFSYDRERFLAMLVRVKRGASPLPLPEKPATGIARLSSVHPRDVLDSELAELKEEESRLPFGVSDPGRFLALLRPELLPEEVPSLLAEALNIQLRRLELALRRCSASADDHIVLSKVVSCRPEDNAMQRLARAWVYAKIDRQRVNADQTSARL